MGPMLSYSVAHMPDRISPIDHQPELDQARFIRADAPDDDAVPLDVLFIGGGPAGQRSGQAKWADREDHQAGVPGQKGRPVECLAGIGLLALGLPFYAVFRRRAVS